MTGHQLVSMAGARLTDASADDCPLGSLSGCVGRAAGRPTTRLAVVGGGTADVFLALPSDEKELLPIGFTPSKGTTAAKGCPQG